MAHEEDDSPRTPRTQAQRSEAAVRSLLDAAVKIVADKGSARMTLTEVGIEAGYSRGNPGRHFGTKVVLLKALAAHLRLIMTGVQDSLVQERTGIDYIEALIGGYLSVDNLTAMRALHILQAEAIMSDSEIAEDMQAFNRSTVTNIARQIQLAMDAGQIPPVSDPVATAVIFVGLARGIVVQWLVDDTVPIERIQTEIPAIVARILGVEASRSVAAGPQAVARARSAGPRSGSGAARPKAGRTRNAT